MSEEALREIALQVRNWGRWGPDDEIGTLNYITPERIAAACRLATTGKVFALGIPLDRNGPQSGTRQRFTPIHTMFRDGGDAPKTPEEVKAAEGYGGSDDWIVMPLQCVTQWDSLAHIFYEGKMYNGYDATLVTSSGAAKNSIFKTKDKIVGRGVLLDVAKYTGVRALEPGYAITVADLEAAFGSSLHLPHVDQPGCGGPPWYFAVNPDVLDLIGSLTAPPSDPEARVDGLGAGSQREGWIPCWEP
jgi:hypothetical protein